MSYNIVTYKLVNNDLQTELYLEIDPDKWKDSQKTLKRSAKTFDVMTEVSKPLEFTKESADYLRLAYEYKSIEADVVLYEYRGYPDADGEYLHSVNNLDFSQYSQDENRVSVPFKTSGLNTIIQAQQGEKFQLERLDDINGNAIPELEKRVVALTSRRILLVSALEKEKTPEIENPIGNFPQTIIATFGVQQVPTMSVIANSDQDNVQTVVSPTFDQNGGGVSNFIFDPLNAFYLFANEPKELNIKINAHIQPLLQQIGGEYINVYLILIRVNDSFQYQEQWNIIYDQTSYDYTDRIVEWEQLVALNTNDSLVLFAAIETGLDGLPKAGIGYKRLDLQITEDSYEEDSTSNVVLMHETGSRLIEILTGDNDAFYSEFYGRTDLGYSNNGDFSYTALALGFWIRNFVDENIEVSLKDFLEASNAIHNTGYSIEVIDGKEKLVVEDLRYFFQDIVTIRLPEQVSKVKRKVASELFAANMSFGYKEGGEYEESMGLDEYNTETGYTLPITKVDTKFSKISPFRADMYGKEFARRRPKLNYPKEDTQYDKDIFVLDLKTTLGVNLAERTWEDDFETIPTGVFSPETATNLRITPYRNLERHEWFFGGGLTAFPQEYIRFANSKGNSELTTKKVNEVPRSENGNKKISEINDVKVKFEWIEFEYPVDYYLNQIIYGKTNINGRMVNNYYGKVEFINENGQKEYGYLFNLEPNKEGKWKLLKAL